MSATPTPAPSQTVKGIDQAQTRQTVSVFNEDPSNPETLPEVSLKVDNMDFQNLLKHILSELILIRKNMEILTGEFLENEHEIDFEN